MRCILSAIVIFCVGTVALAQIPADSISGTWVGNYTSWADIFMMKPNKLVVELSMHNDTLVTGSSHLYHRGGQYEHYKIFGVWRPADSTIYFSEDSVLAVYVIGGSTCLGNYTMKLKVSDTAMRFEGRWRDNDKSFLHCPSTGVFLQKPLPRLPPAATASAAAPRDKMLERPSDIQSLIEIAPAEMDSIRVELLDNAEIDGDIVSVFLDDKLIVKKQRLAAEPYVFYMSVSRGAPICRIKMAAESMGSILPCTAHMIVTTAAGKRYEVDLASSFGNNGVLELFLKE